MCQHIIVFFFFKQKTAYEMRISDWSSDVCSSDLIDAWLDDRFTLISHALQLDELRDVSRRDKIRALIRPSEAGRLVNQIAAIADMPERLPAVQRSRDPRDDFLLGLCEAGRADWLVTGEDRKSTRLNSSH